MPTNFTCQGRGMPDLVMNGHNCPTWQNTQLQPVDGTSCSAPMFAGAVAYLNNHQAQRGRPPVGFFNPTLYHMSLSGVYHDLADGYNWCTEYRCCPTRKDGGSDFGYKATRGWDPVTGNGEPNLGLMVEWFDIYT